MALIELQGVVKRYDERAVLAGVNLAVNEGDVTVVMGPSGCGKSTLLRCINRLVDPTSGSIRFRGQEITGPGVDVRALRQGIGFVFQQFALYRHLSVLDNVTLALRKLRGLSRTEADARAMHELDRLGLAAQRDQYPAQISGGQKQRVALARALAMDPAVVFFDEPTSALDPLCVTHDLALAQEISERVVFLDQGVVRAEDTVEQLSRHHEDARVREFFRREGSAP